MAGQRRRLGLIAGVAAVVALVVGFAGWYFLIRDDAPDAANIDTAARRSTRPPARATRPATKPTPTTAAGAGERGWTVDTSLGSFDDFSGTWAGYRVEEELASIGTSTAVGRTPDVSGTMTVAGGEVTAVDVEVDMTTLTSDNGAARRRSGRGLESDAFPTATFSLTSPIGLPEGVSEGGPVSVQAVGDLTIHGVTREVTVEVEAEIAGRIGRGGGPGTGAADGLRHRGAHRLPVLSIDDNATFEFQIFFARD